jgi:nickel transport protein
VDVQHATTGASLYQGRTNDQGHFSFSLADTVKAEKAPLRIIVSSGEGHRNEWLLQPDVAQVQETDQAATTVPAAGLSGAAGSVSNEELTLILEQLLEEKLAPIRRSLAQSQEPPPKLTDILGGIGYLIGLAGIMAWMKSRK